MIQGQLEQGVVGWSTPAGTADWFSATNKRLVATGTHELHKIGVIPPATVMKPWSLSWLRVCRALNHRWSEKTNCLARYRLLVKEQHFILQVTCYKFFSTFYTNRNQKQHKIILCYIYIHRHINRLDKFIPYTHMSNNHHRLYQDRQQAAALHPPPPLQPIMKDIHAHIKRYYKSKFTKAIWRCKKCLFGKTYKLD